MTKKEIYTEGSLVDALKDGNEQLREMFAEAVRECDKMEAENKRLKQIIRRVRAQVNCDDSKI